MTGIETGLLLLVVGLLGVTGGKVWERKSVKEEYLPRVEHGLNCDAVQLRVAASIRNMKEEILEAIKNNGKCSGCEGNSSRTTK